MTNTCPRCNTANLPQAAFCANCSAPLSPGPSVGAPANQFAQGQVGNAPEGASQKAIIALVLAIAALFCCGPLTGIAAAIVGWMELNAIKSGQSSPAGKWMAQVGIGLGIGASILHIIIGIVYFLLIVVSSAR